MEKGLTKRDETTGAVAEQTAERQVGSESASREQEIRAMVAVAKRFPRDEEAAFRALMKAAERPDFAEEAAYSFPRGDKTVTGPSIVLAREAKRLWGNIKGGLLVIADDEETRHIRGYAWDQEHNTYEEAEDVFRKLVFRKGKGWIVPDERDLRELTNRRGAILVRNCILALVPKDWVDAVLAQCAVTLQGSASADLPATRQKALQAFAELGIKTADLERKLGHAFADTTAEELAELRGIYRSISDGHSKWSEYVAGAAPGDEEQDVADAARLKDAQAGLSKAALATGEPVPELIDDARWGRIVTYLDADTNRAAVKSAVKKKMKVEALSTIEPHKRLAFVLTVQDAAKRGNVPMEVPA